MTKPTYVSECHGADVYWKEKEYFGEHRKTIWICFRCNKPCKVKEVEDDTRFTPDSNFHGIGYLGSQEIVGNKKEEQ